MRRAATGPVVITGGSTGIGEAVARTLDQRGVRVFAGVRSEEAAHKLRRGSSPNLVPILLDVTDPRQIEAAFEEVSRSVGDQGIHGLFNNAGISLSAPLELAPIEGVRRLFEVNLMGVVSVTQAFLPLLRQGSTTGKARGRIVITGSTASLVHLPMMGPYSMSKLAIEAFADVLRLELRPWGMTVSVLRPGIIATPIWDKGLQEAEALFDKASPATRDRYRLLFENGMRHAKRAMGLASPVDVVVRDALHALTSPRPKRSYLMGRGAGLSMLLSMAPRPVLERILSLFTGIDSNKL